jgi:hypothetical protein
MAEKHPHRHKYIAIGLVACSMLMHEILLTRICALRLYFNFAFLVISNCLLGLGASGTVLAVFRPRFERAPRAWLGVFTVAYTVSLVLVYLFLLRFPLPQDLDLSNAGQLLTLTTFNLIGAVPFVFAGLTIGMLLTYDVAHVNRLYAVDLAAAGVGCLACPVLLPLVGAGGVFVVTVLLALGATVALLHDRYGVRILAVGALLFVLGLALLPRFDRMFPLPSKGLFDYVRALEQREKLGDPYSVWTANSRIDMIRGKAGKVGMFMQGHKPVEIVEFALSAGIAQDAMAGTTITDYSSHPRALEVLKRSMYAAAYRMKEAPDVLVIGLGGGNDVWAAKASGARSVKAFELNWPIVDIHEKVLRSFSRGIVDDPNIQLLVGEGRSGLMRETMQYDVIQMTGIDTWTALASGAYVLAENYLYTREAIASMYTRLKPDGILQIARFSETMEALRLMSNINAALESLGVVEMEASVVALGTPDKMMAVQLKKGVYSLGEQSKIFRFAVDNGMDVIYLPDRHANGQVEKFVRAKDKASVIRDFPMNITPTDDDRPYFFNYTRWDHPIASVERIKDVPSVSQGNPFFILAQLLLSVVASALFIYAPVARRGGRDKVPGKGNFLLYFMGLGLGFIFIEIAVIQKLTLFLGQPVYSLTVTLFSLLVFTGVGSLLFGGRMAPGDRRILVVPAGIALYIAIFTLASPFVVRTCIGLPLAVRILMTAIGLAPLGILLGVPFSYGLRVLERSFPHLTPWAWAINGCSSVVGSVATVVVSMNFGFAAVLWTATVVYAVAFYALLKAPAPTTSRHAVSELPSGAAPSPTT